MVCRPDGSVVFESRAEQGLSIDHVNLKEKERFMKGEKVRQDLCSSAPRGREGEGPSVCSCFAFCLRDLLEGDGGVGPFLGWGYPCALSCFVKHLFRDLTLLSHSFSLP